MFNQLAQIQTLLQLEASLRIATINVRGLAARRWQYQLSRLFADNELDIVAVQETKVEGQEHTDRMVQPFQPLFNVCVAHAVGLSGVAVYLSVSLRALLRRLWSHVLLVVLFSLICLIQILIGSSSVFMRRIVSEREESFLKV